MQASTQNFLRIRVSPVSVLPLVNKSRATPRHHRPAWRVKAVAAQPDSLALTLSSEDAQYFREVTPAPDPDTINSCACQWFVVSNQERSAILSGPIAFQVDMGNRPDLNTAAPGDFYELLGVEENADQATVRAAYRSLQRVVHPDIIGKSSELTSHVLWESAPHAACIVHVVALFTSGHCILVLPCIM